jgi:hypothetical protein
MLFGTRLAMIRFLKYAKKQHLAIGAVIQIEKSKHTYIIVDRNNTDSVRDERYKVIRIPDDIELNGRSLNKWWQFSIRHEVEDVILRSVGVDRVLNYSNIILDIRDYTSRAWISSLK